MSKKKDIACFGLYLGGPVCDACTANRRCKALLVSSGFDLVNSLVDQLEETMPTGAVFTDTDRVTELIDQLLKPSMVAADKNALTSDLIEALSNHVESGALDVSDL